MTATIIPKVLTAIMILMVMMVVMMIIAVLITLELWGGLHYSAVSKAAARLERELSKDKDLAKLLDRLVSNVKT
jgi:hypothetical protein